MYVPAPYLYSHSCLLRINVDGILVRGPFYPAFLLGLVRWLVVVLLGSYGTGGLLGEAIDTMVLHSERNQR